MLDPDFRDMLVEFNSAGVEYLVVGAYALAGHGLSRATRGLDLWVRRSPENAADRQQTGERPRKGRSGCRVARGERTVAI